MPLATCTESSCLMYVITNPSPPMLEPAGSATPSANATAMAASTALPPLRSITMPACAASGWFATTAPLLPICGGRNAWPICPCGES